MKLTVTGIPPYDGKYGLDLGRLTSRDLHDIKRLSGHMPMELEHALEQADTDVIVALAVIALRKSGQFQRINEDAIWDSELGAITLDFADEEADAVPPPSETGTPSTPSGSPSNIVSELHPENHQRLTGTPSSELPESASATSAS